MVAQFLGLKLRLMGNAFRRSPWQVFAFSLGLLYALAITVVVVGSVVAARSASEVASVHSFLVVLGSIAVLGFLLLPLLFGIDDALDPRAFALFGIPNRQLAGGLLLAGLIGVPALVMTVCSFAIVITWSGDVVAAVLAVVAAVIIVPTVVLCSQVAAAVASLFRSTRRSREAGGVIGVLLLVLLAPAVLLLLTVDWGRDGLSAVGAMASWLQWTPLGAAWSAPGAAASGDGAAALLQILIALATLGVLWLAWVALVRRVLTTPSREAMAHDHRSLGWFARLPGGPTAAIAARSMTYWCRDARYWVALMMIPVVPVLVIVALTLAGLPVHSVALIPLPLVCLFLGWMIHNDLAFDGTAIWLHVVSGTRGVADRAGRLFPPVLIGIPLIAVGSVATAAAFGDWTVLPSVAALSGAILGTGIGLSSVSSVLFPYPATKPGDSAFSQPQTSGAVAALVQASSFFAILILVSPAVVFLILGLTVSPFWLGVSPVVAVFVGFVSFFGGISIGGRLFDRRGPELMAFAVRND